MSQREIKFRGIRVDNGEWVFGFWGNRPDGANFICPIETYESFAVIPETIGQYTGLKDKNKVDLYDGDVIEYKLIHVSGQTITVTCAISWGKHGWHPFTDSSYCMNEAFDICVMGNIHEHPHLPY